MKHLALLRNCAIALSLCAGFTACSDDDDPTDPTVPETPVEHDVTLDVASATSSIARKDSGTTCTPTILL